MTAPTPSRTNAPLTTSAAVAPPPDSQDSELAPLSVLDADVAQAIEASRSHHTRRVLASRWRAFTDWAQAHDVAVLPAAPQRRGALRNGLSPAWRVGGHHPRLCVRDRNTAPRRQSGEPVRPPRRAPSPQRPQP